MEIRIDRDSSVPIYLQISGGIKDMILSGKLPEGFRLPPERKLARAKKKFQVYLNRQRHDRDRWVN